MHVDTVESLPAGATPLAHNDMGLQAAEIKLKKGSFWGVQYHPEYSCAEIAAMARRYADVLIRDGLVKDQARARCAGGRSRGAQRRPGRRAPGLAFRRRPVDHRSGHQAGRAAQLARQAGAQVIAILLAAASLSAAACRASSRTDLGPPNKSGIRRCSSICRSLRARPMPSRPPGRWRSPSGAESPSHRSSPATTRRYDLDWTSRGRGAAHRRFELWRRRRVVRTRRRRKARWFCCTGICRTAIP